MRSGGVLLVAATIFCSCSRQSPHTTTVNVDTLANVYADLLILNERYNLGTDSLSAQEYEADYHDVLQQHKYTKEEFESQMQSAAGSPDEFRVLCERVLTRFQEIRRRPLRIGIHANS
jgi:Domain of unknown function (DUF4296)